MTFTKTPIFRYFDSDYYIWIKTDTLRYSIDRVLSQMTLDQLFSDHMTHKNYSDFFKSEIGQWHLVVFFFQKIIPIKMRYKTHNQELLAIVEAFKTWRHYLKGCK